MPTQDEAIPKQPIEFLPAPQGPDLYSVSSRLDCLRWALESNNILMQRHCANILTLIQYNEDGGKVPTQGQTMWLVDGKFVDGEPTYPIKSPDEDGKELDKGEAGKQDEEFAGEDEEVAGQMAQSASFGLFAGGTTHEIYARFRLPAILGGNPNLVINVTIANNTGSDIRTLFTQDLAALQFSQATYNGPSNIMGVGTANGSVQRVAIVIEMQIIKADGTALMGWFRERAVITPPGGSRSRLSGSEIRNHLYFATAPGNGALYVAAKKNGIIRPLPAV